MPKGPSRAWLIVRPAETSRSVDPLVPVMVNVDEPTDDLSLVTTLSAVVTDEFPVVSEAVAGLKIAVTPRGRPFTRYATDPLKPSVPLSVTE